VNPPIRRLGFESSDRAGQLSRRYVPFPPIISKKRLGCQATLTSTTNSNHDAVPFYVAFETVLTSGTCSAHCWLSLLKARHLCLQLWDKARLYDCKIYVKLHAYLCLACQGYTLKSDPPLPRVNVPLFIDRLHLDTTRGNNPPYCGWGGNKITLKVKTNTGKPCELRLITSEVFNLH
jgi:hypothetical protein